MIEYNKTRHLQLMKPTQQDTMILSNLWRCERVRAFLGGILPDDAIKEKINNLLHHWEQFGFGLFSVYSKNIEQVIGLCGPHHSEDGIELSYMFFPEFWGKGFAREAAMASIDFSFQSLDVDSLIAITQRANVKSCALLEKIGMTDIANFERFNAEQRMYKITQDEWKTHGSL